MYRRNLLKKMFLSKNVIFWGLSLSQGHFGQQAPEGPVSQLQNGASTSSLPPFFVDILTFKDYPTSNSFFSMGILEGVKWQTSQADYNGPKQLCFRIKKKCLFWPNNSFFFSFYVPIEISSFQYSNLTFTIGLGAPMNNS